jgi:CIC family chloride channel protein
MGAVFAGAARAPITAVIIIFELTGDYTIILPLMAAIVLATGVSRLASSDTIYTLKLRRRGIDIDHRPSASQLATTTVSRVIEPVLVTVPGNTALIDVASQLAGAAHGQLPVTSEDGEFVGVITARGLAEALADGEHDDAAARSFVEQLPAVTTATTLDDALDALDSAGATALPVFDEGRDNFVGWLTLQSVLNVLRPPTPAPTASAHPGKAIV